MSTTTVKAAHVGFVRDLTPLAAHIADQSDLERQTRLLGKFEAKCAKFDDLPRSYKLLVLAAAFPRYPQAGFIVVLADRERKVGYRAHRAGDLARVGYGDGQVEAVDALIALEARNG